MDGLELLRSHTRFTQTLPSGLTYTLRLPAIDKCMILGAVPLPVLQHVQAAAEANKEAPDVTAEEAVHMLRFQDQLVIASVLEVEGRPVSLSPETVDDVPPMDRKEIVAFATRERPIPKVDSPPSENSDGSPPPTLEKPSPVSSNGSAETQPRPSNGSIQSSPTTSEQPS